MVKRWSMTEKEPTQEQIREFWEWCGFRFKLSASENPHYWIDSYGRALSKLPKADLNNLFKYALPKLGLVTVSIYPDKWIEQPTRWCAEIKSNSDKHPLFRRASSEDPALALFWAIYLGNL